MLSDAITCTTTGSNVNENAEPKRPKLRLECKFGRRAFHVKLDNATGTNATVADLAHAIMSETNIPCDKQRLLFKGMVMDPPDMSGFSTLEDLNLRSGDQVLILNSRRVGTDDDEKNKLGDLKPLIQATDKQLENIFYQLDRLQRCPPVQVKSTGNVLESLRLRAIALEKEYMKHIQSANECRFDYRNAADQARKREIIDTCQRQLDKISELTAAIFDKLALTQASVGGAPVLQVAYRDGPCPRLERPPFTNNP